MSSGKRVLKRASPSTIQDKLLVGYQGWFSCAGDGEPIYPGHSGWLHWFDEDRPNIDVWPDVSSYSPSELFPAHNLKLKTGEQAFLFSSRHPKTVQRHFHWMAEHGIDGAFLQRFAEQCQPGQPGQENGIRKLRDEIGQVAREAAEKEGRVFSIMYDVSNVPADKIQHILERDWIHLIRNLGVLDSPNYLKEKGRPVIGLWGFGFNNRGHTPDLVRSIIRFFRATTPGGAYIFGGAPSSWRLSEGDADHHPGFVDVWLNEFDAISPWTVGRYRNEAEAERFAESKMKGDMELIKQRNESTGRKVDYVPVVHPGGSGFNLSKGNWAFNDAPRMGGKFLWKQIFYARRLGVRSLYGAMWDEYDEGTAFMPVVTHKRNLPQSDVYRFMALDEEGYDLPSDWYMRICGMAAEGLRSERWIHETFPLKELQDYWSSRPKHEEIETYTGAIMEGPSGSGSKDETSGTEQAAYQQWLSSQSGDKDEPPPPPYSLLAEDTPSATTNVSTALAQPTVAPSSSTPSPSGSTTPAPILEADIIASVPKPAQGSPVRAHAIPSVVPSDVSPTVLNTTHNLPATAPSTLVAATPASYSQDQPGVIVPADQAVPFSRPDESPSPSLTLNGFQEQNPPRFLDPILSLSNDFARTNVASPSLGSPREESGPVGPTAILPVSTGGRVNTTLPPPLHPARPAANRPVSYGRPSVSRPPPSTQSYTPNRPSPVPSLPAQAAGTWTTAQWPPKEWDISSESATAGANLGRLQTFSGSSNVTSGGANLRPTASISGPPHSLSNTRPSTAGGGSSPKPPVHVPGSFPQPTFQSQSSISDYPPAGFSEVSSHSPSSPVPGRYEPAPYHSGITAPRPPSNHGTTPYHPGPAVSYNTHPPSPPLPGGYGNYHAGPVASNPYHSHSPYFPHQYSGGGFMPSVPNIDHSQPFHPSHPSHDPSFPHPSMPAPWVPTGPGMPVGPVGAIGPVGPIGPNSMDAGSMYTPQPGPQYVYGTPTNWGGTNNNNNPLNFALSAVDMVAGRKTRDQLQGLANKFLK